MKAPVIVKTFPSQVVNEQASYGPVNLSSYVEDPDHEGALRFSAALSNGNALPKGMICTADGLLTGIPAKGTIGNYEVVVTAENDAGKLEIAFVLTIKPSLAGVSAEYFDQLKEQVWQAIHQQLPIPSTDEILNRPIGPGDIYYLLQRWGTLTIWDAFNLEPPEGGRLLTLAGASQHYAVIDRGSCLIAAPLDLFSYERTLEDGLQTARAMAAEVYQRNWTIELTGFDKFVRAAWVALQHLGDRYGKRLEIINYHPSTEEVKLYHNQVIELMEGQAQEPE